MIAAGLGDLLDGQAAGAGGGHVAADAGESGVHHEADAGQGEGGLGDVGRDDDFTAAGLGKNTLLVGLGEAAEKRDDLSVAVAAFEDLAAFADVALGRHEDEDIAAGGRAVVVAGEDAFDGLDRAVNVVEGFGARSGLVALGGVGAQGIERRVDDLDWIGATGDLDDRCVVEGFGKHLGVNGGGSDDDAELGALEAEITQVAEEEIYVERTLVGLVENDGIVGAKERVGLDLGEQHAVGHEFHHGVAGSAVLEANFATDLATPLHAQFLGDAAGDGKGGDAAGLGAGDLAASASAGGEAHFRDLGGFAGAGLAREDEHLMFAEQVHDLTGALADGQLGRKVNPERKVSERCGGVGHELSGG